MSKNRAFILTLCAAAIATSGASTARAEDDDDISLGADFSPWKHFAFYAGLKYLNADLELSNGQSSAVDPLVARLGVAARF